MNTPNRLTIARMAAIPFFMAALLCNFSLAGRLAAPILFIAASLTDMIDGKIARKYGLITDFGKLMDPLADKLLVFSALLIFIWQGRLHPVFAFIILARELMMTIMRTMAMGKGRVLAAGKSGKIKTAVQMTCIVAMLLLPLAADVGLLLPTGIIDTVLGLAMALVTLWSGIDYISANRDLFSDIK